MHIFYLIKPCTHDSNGIKMKYEVYDKYIKSCLKKNKKGLSFLIFVSIKAYCCPNALFPSLRLKRNPKLFPDIRVSPPELTLEVVPILEVVIFLVLLH